MDAVIDRSKYTEEVPVKMPGLGGTNAGTKSKVVKWYIKPGDIVQREDVICDIETPDFTFGMQTDDEELAIVGDLLVETGQPVPDGEVICMLYHEAKEEKKPKKTEAIVKDDADDEDAEEDTEEKADDDDAKDDTEEKVAGDEQKDEEKHKPQS